MGDVAGSPPIVVWESTTSLFEAPNWSPDGRWLVFNQEGDLYRIAPHAGATPERITMDADISVNNDHVISADGRTLYVSATDWHLYRLPFEGGVPRRISHEQPHRFMYFLHGVSPDERTVTFVSVQFDADGKRQPINTYTIPTTGGSLRRVTNWKFDDDGPEYSPDGAWIYFNSTYPSETPGHSRLCRMRPDGSSVEVIFEDERVNWFPHVSPDGRTIQYITFPTGTLGHPANLEVSLGCADADGRNARDLYRFHGGQGTTNVNGWASDSRRFAYVAYPRG
ncbi:MAG: biopolymer transporter Tol [Chloroflexi bacterium]|nr:biopolymer transporter Tol [Chloroflexota bacterium]